MTLPSFRHTLSSHFVDNKNSSYFSGHLGRDNIFLTVFPTRRKIGTKCRKRELNDNLLPFSLFFSSTEAAVLKKIFNERLSSRAPALKAI